MLRRDEFGISDEEIKKLIEEVDVNKDNFIDYNEFLEMMKNDLKV